MRIAVTVDPEIPVPPKLYGGIERIVDMLVRALVERGHDVTLFAHPDSQVPCHLLPYPVLHSRGTGNVLRNLHHVSSQLRSGGFDVVHSFARLAYLLPVLPLRLPKIMSYQRAISPRSILAGELFSRGTLHFTACSRHLIRRWTGKLNWHVVYNGVPLCPYRARYDVPGDAPLAFLGRVVRIKGVHLAIEVARRSGRRLRIAGNVPVEPEHQAYFREQILPHVDGKNIEYVGPVDDAAKNALLGESAALLMPVLWEEPFGIVMAEALACGTPVIGLRRGSVPEVVEDGVTGFVCGSADEMISAVSRIPTIERRACRETCEQKFSDSAITDAYLDLYSALVDREGMFVKGRDVCGSV
jgi:glycosyltransferase involved in cell wall biosynthesis